MRELGLSAKSLGIALGHSGNGGVSNILSGKRPFPLDQADRWANILRWGKDQDPAAYSRFLDAAMAEHAAPAIVARLEEARQQLREAELALAGWDLVRLADPGTAAAALRDAVATAVDSLPQESLKAWIVQQATIIGRLAAYIPSDLRPELRALYARTVDPAVLKRLLALGKGNR